MKRLTLNETWKLCLAMWKWIAGQAKKEGEEGIDIEGLKDQWLKKHGYDKGDISDACFFCEYHRQHPTKGTSCNCPATKIDKEFNCMEFGYCYCCHPIAFYNKLVSLNRKRRKK